MFFTLIGMLIIVITDSSILFRGLSSLTTRDLGSMNDVMSLRKHCDTGEREGGAMVAAYLVGMGETRAGAAVTPPSLPA